MSTVQKSIRLYAWKTNYQTFRIVQGEVDSRTFNIQLFSTTIPVNLSKCSVMLYAVKPDSNVVYTECDVLDAINGLVSVTLDEQIAAVEGTVDCWIQVIGEGGTDLRFEGMNIQVGECDITRSIESSSEFKAFLQQSAKVGELEQEVKAARMGSATLADKERAQDNALAGATSTLRAEFQSEDADIREEFAHGDAVLQQNIDAEKARIDQLTASPEIGEGDLEKEMGDLRVGDDGVTYGSAGTAVRERMAVRNVKAEKMTDVPEIQLPIQEVQQAIEAKGQEVLDSIPEEYTDLSEEVTGIRTGADGEVYKSAGEAVRTQFTNLKSDLIKNDVTSHTGVVPSNATVTIGQSGYTTIEIPVELNEIVVIKDIQEGDFEGLPANQVFQGFMSDGTRATTNDESNALFYGKGVVFPNTAYYNFSKVLVLIKTTALSHITIITSNNANAHDGKIDVENLPLEALTLSELPVNKNMISDTRKISNSGVNYRGGGEYMTTYCDYNYETVAIYGAYPVKKGTTLNFKYGTGMLQIGFICDSSFKFVDSFRTSNYPTNYEVTTDGFVFFMDNIKDHSCSVIMSDNSKVGMIPKYLVEATNANKNLVGKKWTSFGDSITARNGWQPYIANYYGLEHTNLGIGSTTLAYVEQWESQYPCMVNADRIQAVKDSNPDILTILGGANDAVRNVSVGTTAELSKALEEKDKTTFTGALSYLIETMLTWKPTLNIILLTTTYTNVASHHELQTQYAEAVREVAHYYGLKIADTNRESGITQFNTSTYTTDGVHPNEAGYLKLANIVASEIEDLYRIN